MGNFCENCEPFDLVGGPIDGHDPTMIMGINCMAIVSHNHASIVRHDHATIVSYDRATFVSPDREPRSLDISSVVR